MPVGTESMQDTDAGEIRVEVAYAHPRRQVIVELTVSKGCTAREAVDLSGIAGQFPELSGQQLALGIFSRPLNGVELPLPEVYVLEAGDRVEIYRPLMMDPKQARLERARRNLKG